MTIDTVTDAMDSMVNGMFVDHRSAYRHPAIKSMWSYKYDLFYISPEREKETIIMYKTLKKASMETMDSLWEEIYKEILPLILDYVSSDRFKKLRKDVQ